MGSTNIRRGQRIDASFSEHMIDYTSLSVERVFYLHDQIILSTGGKPGIQDLPLLCSALERCKATFAGEDLYLTIYDKAATLFRSLTMNHPFLDANKRTAYQVMKYFLYTNGLHMKAEQQEIVELCITTANNILQEKEVAIWVKKHTRNINLKEISL